jgi:hypothetical protein
MCSTYTTHLILLDLITLAMLGEEYKLWNSSLRNFLHEPSSSHLGPNIFLNALFSKPLSLCWGRNTDWGFLRTECWGRYLDLWFDSRRGLGIFLFTTVSRTALGPTQLPIQWVSRALSLEVKRPGREADNSPPSRAEVKEWVELYLHSPIRLHDVVLS